MSKAEDARLLGVDEEAGEETLKSAFRTRARDCHPDLVGEACGADFVALRAAFERLRDGHWENVEPLVSNGRPPVEEVTPHRPGQRQTDFVDLFDAALAGMRPDGRGRQVIDHIELEVPLDYLLFGASLSLYVPVEMACRTCGGRRMVADATGIVLSCPVCHGQGSTERQLKVPINLPPGLRAGQTFRVPLEPAGLKGYDILIELALSRG